MTERHLEWAGCRNVRDLGGLPLADGRATRWRSIVRADSLDRLTPLYYRPFLEQKVDRCVAAVRAVAQASPGGVVIHCGIGRDRTGLVARGTTIASALESLLSEVDVEACLRDAGLQSCDIDAVRDRMIVDNFGHGPR
jgi:hypothetical protein